MTKKALRNYINTVSNRIERKKMYKAKKQWIVVGLSALIATGTASVFGITPQTNANASIAHPQNALNKYIKLGHYHMINNPDYTIGQNYSDNYNQDINPKRTLHTINGNQKATFHPYARVDNVPNSANPQSTVIEPNGTTFVAYDENGSSDSGTKVRIVRYNNINSRTNKYAKTSELSHPKVGSVFNGGHGQALAYNPKTNQLWLEYNVGHQGSRNNVKLMLINQKTLQPEHTLTFSFEPYSFGAVLAFDNNGNAYNAVNTVHSHQGGAPVGSLQIYKGKISANNAHFHMVQGLRHTPGATMQNMSYNPANNRIYFLADGNYTSVPANKLGNGLTPSDVKSTELNSHYEPEDLAFHNGHSYLLLHYPSQLVRTGQQTSSLANAPAKKSHHKVAKAKAKPKKRIVKKHVRATKPEKSVTKAKKNPKNPLGNDFKRGLIQRINHGMDKNVKHLADSNIIIQYALANARSHRLAKKPILKKELAKKGVGDNNAPVGSARYYYAKKLAFLKFINTYGSKYFIDNKTHNVYVTTEYQKNGQTFLGGKSISNSPTTLPSINQLNHHSKYIISFNQYMDIRNKYDAMAQSLQAESGLNTQAGLKSFETLVLDMNKFAPVKMENNLSAKYPAVDSGSQIYRPILNNVPNAPKNSQKPKLTNNKKKQSKKPKSNLSNLITKKINSAKENLHPTAHADTVKKPTIHKSAPVTHINKPKIKMINNTQGPKKSVVQKPKKSATKKLAKGNMSNLSQGNVPNDLGGSTTSKPKKAVQAKPKTKINHLNQSNINAKRPSKLSIARPNVIKNPATASHVDKLDVNQSKEFRNARVMRLSTQGHFRYLRYLQQTPVYDDASLTMQSHVGMMNVNSGLPATKIQKEFKVTSLQNSSSKVVYEIRIGDHNYFIDGSPIYTQNAYVQNSEVAPRLQQNNLNIRIKKTCSVFKSRYYNSNTWLHELACGTVLHVAKVIHIGPAGYQQTRFVLSNGDYVTANKNYVQIV